jgi:hypothetical protein
MRSRCLRHREEKKNGELIQLPKQKRQRRYKGIGGKLLVQSCPPAAALKVFWYQSVTQCLP